MVIAAVGTPVLRVGDCRRNRRRCSDWRLTTKPLLRTSSGDRRPTAADSAALCIADRWQWRGLQTFAEAAIISATPRIGAGDEYDTVSYLGRFGGRVCQRRATLGRCRQASIAVRERTDPAP